MQKQTSKTAFSIIELSIVVTIIAALIGGIILAGQISLSAKLTTARSLTKSSPVNDIDNLVLWFETTMPQSVDDLSADDGQEVSIWYDLSPNHNNATAGNSPTYITNGINSLPVLRFDGADDYLSFDGSGIVSSNYTIFIVEQRRSGTAYQYIIGTSNSNLATSTAIIIGYDSNTVFKINQWGLPDITTAVNPYTTPIPIINTINFNSNIGKNIYRNGLLAVSSTDSDAKSTLLEYRDAAIGQINDALYYNGDVAEIIIFNKYLNSNERKDVEQYLSKKWGITLS